MKEKEFDQREPVMKWTPTKERLPEKDGKYLCCWQGMSIETGRRRMSEIKHADKRAETHSCVNERTETHGDAVSREDAIEAARNLQTYKLDERDDMLLVDLADVQTELMMMPSAEPKWVPVSEGLPEDYQDVLVWFEYFRYGDYNCMYSTYGIGNYSNRYNSWLINHETGWTDLHVFAWMELPEPPKMEGEQE